MTDSHHHHNHHHHHSDGHHGIWKITSYKTILTAAALGMVFCLVLLYGFARHIDRVPILPLDTPKASVASTSASPQLQLTWSKMPILPLETQKTLVASTSASPQLQVAWLKRVRRSNRTEEKVRLLCLVLTMEKDLQTKVKAVNSTWVTRCDKHFYVISSKIRRRDFLNIDIPDSRTNLVHKMQATYRIIYKKYLNEFDFLLKADDDSYIIVENLKYLLSHYKGSEPGYLGYHFNQFVKNGYMSGGAGYVISNRGLRDMVENGLEKGLCNVQKNPEDPENSEDLETGRCLQTAGVPALSSLDVEGRETFHPYPLEKHLFGTLPGYLFKWAKNPVKTGLKCCGRYTISFHYMSPESIYFIDHLLYQTTVYGHHSKYDALKPAFRTGKVT